MERSKLVLQILVLGIILGVLGDALLRAGPWALNLTVWTFAVVTGAGQGIGRGAAIALAEEGADVVVSDIKEAPLKETAMLVKGLGRRALPLRMDVTSADDVQTAVERIVAEFHQLDILVNNAGVCKLNPVLDISPEDWDRGVPCGEWTVKDLIAHLVGDLSPSGAGLIYAGVLNEQFIADTSRFFDVRGRNQAVVEERRRWTHEDYEGASRRVVEVAAAGGHEDLLLKAIGFEPADTMQVEA